MPDAVRRVLDRCVHERSERAQVCDRTEYLRQVARHLDVAPSEAESLAREVFAAMWEWLPRNQAYDVASQLPSELRELWGDPGKTAA